MRISPIAALSFRDFRVFWPGFIVQCVSMMMQVFAIGWLVVELAARDGRGELGPLYLGLLGLARAVPSLGLGLFGGVIADRFDRKWLLIATQAAFGVTTIVLGMIVITDRVSIVAVLILAGIFAGAASVYHPTRQAIQPRMVGERTLLSAFGLNTLALNAGALVGPLLGGLLIGPLGVGGVLLVSGVMWLIVAGWLLLLSPYPVEGETHGAGAFGSVVEGLRYVRRDSVVMWLLIAFGAATLLARPYPDLLPAVARDVLEVGPQQLSWMVAATGAGAILAGLVTASLGSMRRRGLFVLASSACTGVTLTALSLQRDLVPAIALIVLAGFSMMLSAGMIAVVIQTTTPDRLRGRVTGVQNVIVDGGMPTGTLLLGSLGAVIGVGAAIGTAGALLMLACVFIALRAPALRDARTTAGPIVGTSLR